MLGTGRRGFIEQHKQAERHAREIAEQLTPVIGQPVTRRALEDRLLARGECLADIRWTRHPHCAVSKVLGHDRVAIHASDERLGPLDDSPDCRSLKATQHIERTVTADIAVSPREFDFPRHSFPGQLGRNPIECGGSA